MNEIATANGTARKKVLLVGGAGFIGHNLALKFTAEGYDVTVADSFQINNLLYIWDAEKLVDEPELYEAILHERRRLLKEAGCRLRIIDFRDYHAACELVEQVQPDIVVMLAAVAHASRSNKDPYSTFDHSLRTLENILDACRKKSVRLVYMSSSTVYGNFEKDMVDEDDTCNPLGIYASLKVAGEIILKAYHTVYGMEYAIVRPSALYGERCISRRVGQIYIESALAGRPLVYSAFDGEKLDFTYIADLVKGIFLASTRPGGANQTFNITRGDARPIMQLVEILREEFSGIEVIRKERDGLVPKRGTLSIERARDLLGFEPEYPLEVGYRDYINWYRHFLRDHAIQLSHEIQANE